jgi:hypothetical protein
MSDTSSRISAASAAQGKPSSNPPSAEILRFERIPVDEYDRTAIRRLQREIAQETGISLDFEKAKLLYVYRAGAASRCFYAHEIDLCEALEKRLAKLTVERALGGGDDIDRKWDELARQRRRAEPAPKPQPQPAPEPPSAPGSIKATPHVWRDPKTIPPRDFVYGFDIVRRYVSGIVSMGGVGKTSEIQTELAAMVTGRDLLGVKPKRPYRCWYINLEDPRDEIDRRMAAIFKHYKITEADLGDRLFTDSGRDRNFVIARENRTGLVFDQNVIADISKTITDNEIEVVIVDPFVNCVEVGENDNNKMAQVIREWASIAEKHNCAVVLVHHVRKGSGQSSYTVEDARGAGALINSCRSVRVLNTMTKAEGEKAGVERYRSYFRIDGGKSNLTPPPEDSEWRKIVSVDLDNATDECPADRIGVVTLWTWPKPKPFTADDLRAAQKAVAEGGPWRKDIQAKDWVGKPIADALGLDLDAKDDKERVKAALKLWINDKAFRVIRRDDDNRNPRDFVEVGKKLPPGKDGGGLQP